MDRAIEVRCEQAGARWRCHVTVGDDPAATHHEVEVGADTLAALARDADPETAVRAAFEFLLEREPRESILRRFELGTIGRYFPDWQEAVRRRLSS